MSPNRYLVLAKIETTQFTDATPTGAANAMLVSNLSVQPLKVTSEDRALKRPYFGNSEQLVVGEECKISFDVEIAGSGTAGTAPKFGPLLRACGMAETLTASTKAVYNPISSAFEHATIYCYLDQVLAAFLGCAGTVKFTYNAQKIAKMSFEFTGKYTPVTDAAMPSADYTGFQVPVPALPAYITTLTVGGYAAKCSALTLDVANEVSHAVWMNLESLDITDRKPKGSASVQAVTVAAKDYHALVRVGTTQALSIVHGTTAGNIVQLDAPKMQLATIKPGTFQNTLTWDFDLSFVPNVGNDEFLLTFK